MHHGQYARLPQGLFLMFWAVFASLLWVYTSYSLSSLKGDYIDGNVGDYYGGY